jgi:hypothetical protein
MGYFECAELRRHKMSARGTPPSVNEQPQRQEGFVPRDRQAVRRDAYWIRRPLCTSTGEPSAIKAESGAQRRISPKPEP